VNGPLSSERLPLSEQLTKETSMKDNIKIIKTNANGVELTDCGSFWSISKPVLPKIEGGPYHNVYHTGSEKYIKTKWNRTYCRNQGKPDNSMIVY
jgi:hypothetical protein